MSKEADESRDNVVVSLSSNVSANGYLFTGIDQPKPIIVGSTIGSQLGSPVSIDRAIKA